jgi:hypothetical protein
MAINAEQNQLDEANKKDSTPVAPVTGGGAASAPSASSGRVADYSTGNQSKGSSSGRFTNLQNYLGANQGATDRLYKGIGNKIETTAQPKKQEADTQASAVREGIQGAQQNLNRGQGYYNQMQDQGFNAQDFVSDQDRLTDYAKFQSGQAVDVNNLNNLNSNAQTAAMQVQDAYKQRANQVGNEQGRFGLLKETYGQNQPGYSAGQQRLDNLFLQAGGGGKVGALQADVRNQLNAAGQNLNALTGQVTSDIGNVGANQTSLAKNLLDTSTGMESKFVGDLTAKIPGINDQRQNEIAKTRRDLTKLANREFIESDQSMANLGLERGLRTYGAFDQTKNLEELAKIGRNAENAQDVATAADASQYDALAKLAFGGINNGQYTMDAAKKQINGASTLDPAVQALIDGNGVTRSKNLITGAENAFNDYAKTKTITGTGGAYTGDYGEIGINSTANANLAQLLSGQGASVATSQTNNRGRFGDLGKTGVNQYDLAGTVDTQDDLFRRIAQIRDANDLTSGFGGVTKNYSLDPDQETRNQLSGAGMALGGVGGAVGLNMGDKFLRDLYHNKDFETATNLIPGGALSNLIGGIGGSLFGSKTRKNENLERTSDFMNYGKDAAYTGAQGASDETSLYKQALADLTQRGYFTKT